LAAAGPPTASVSITSNGLNGPVGLAFDRLGNLWVSNPTANTIVMFSADQLAGGGRATQHHGTHVAPGGFLSPIVTLSGSGLNGPGRFSFDAYGNMWVPNAGSSTVVAFTPAQLRVTGAPTPTVVLASSNASIQGPTAVAFDQQGDLWVANTAGNSIVAFGNAAQTASGAPSPVLTFVVPSSYSGPSAMAFDNSGDLWTISSASSSIIEYTAEQITAFGASAPAYTIQVPSNPVSLAFDPPPNGVPVVGPQTHRLPTIRRPLLTRASR
jgi:sugar lactone lactonase YvrE